MNFKKRVNGSWTDTPNYIHNTFTDTITTLPANIYPTGTTATVGLKGQMEQNGTPTPDSPITPSETGDLETVGVKAGQYKIPISSANTTTPIYLGEVETTRRIKKIVFVGSEEENWTGQPAGGGAIRFRYALSNSVQADTAHLTSICTHLPLGVDRGTWNIDDIYTISSNYLWLRLDSNFTTVAALKSWLAQQYANDTPFTIYYTLATPKTAVVNEPLRKIGDYADEVSGITIPTITGANTIDVDTTLKPSEVSINYKGWHPITDVHKAENGQWN